MPLILWPRRGGSSSSTAPTAPTLAVSNNGDGTGGVATLTLGDAGSTHTVYSATQLGGIWTSRGSRTGNGTVAVNPGDGRYWWYALATSSGGTSISNLVYKPLTGGGVRTDSSFSTILSAVATRIIDELSQATTVTCYLALNPDDTPSPNPGEIFFIVSPLGGNFPPGYFDGGEQDQCMDQTGVIVRAYSPIQLDQPQRDDQFLTHATLGIIEQQRLLLKALAGWSPLSGDDPLTAQPLFPHSRAYGRNSRQLAYGEIVFTFPFDWDLAS